MNAITNASQSQKTFGKWIKLILVASLLPAFFLRASAQPVMDTNNPSPAEAVPTVTGPEIWKDPGQPLAARVHDLVSRLSLAEKVSQIGCDPVAIPRLGIPSYSHRNECLHGITAGPATVFPQAIGLAATWDAPLVQSEADVISTEARAKSNDYAAQHQGNLVHRFGVSYYTPNINIFRDPRWGRGQETYGEDPFLTAQTGVAFIRGLQGNDPKYVKIMACAKHFAVHSGPEPLRHVYNATPSDRDLYETYLPAFEAAVREGHVGSVMGAYTSLNGVPDCANSFLLTDLLRHQWGFDGFVVSDGGAIWDIWAEHKYTPTPEATAAAAVKAGCDMCSGNVSPAAVKIPLHQHDWTNDSSGWVAGGEDYNVLTQSVAEGLISESNIDTAVSRELTARFRLGLFDPPAMVPWTKIGIDQNNTPAHQALALKVAEESIVLLKNDGVLPLDRTRIKHIAVIGPNARSINMLYGNYNARASQPITVLEGIKSVAGPDIQVNFVLGCPLALRKDGKNKPTPEQTAKAVAAAQAADVVIFVGGIDPTLEKEEGETKGNVFEGFDRGDRTRIELPADQEDLLKTLHATGKPVVLVNCSGSAMAMPWAAENLPAIVQAWYPGESGGRAVAEVLFGDVNPAGRLPVTFYRSTDDLPGFQDYSMTNRTYRYFQGKPLFAFGYGLSYTKFNYSAPALNADSFHTNDTIQLSFTLKNVGERDGDEIAQVYFRHVHSAVPQPKLALCAYTRVHLTKGEDTTVTLEIPVKRFRYWDATQKQYVVEAGKYELLAGAASDDLRLNVPLNISDAL